MPELLGRTKCCDGNNESTLQEGWEGEHDIVVPISSPLCDVNIDMLEDYLRDKHALSAQASQDSLDNTWRRLHRAWFGESSRPFPTNVSAIRAIAASMKFAKYRSFDNYASRAKRSHIEAWGVWTQDLELEVKDASRSVNRGKGPDRQSAPLQLEHIFDMDPNRFVSKDTGPVDTVRMFLMPRL